MGRFVKSIAIVDDHDLFSQGLALILEQELAGYTLETITIASDLLSRYREGARHDLVICDLIMKQMNGLTFIDEMRAMKVRTPILMLSGINTRAPVDEMRQLGANGFIDIAMADQRGTRAVRPDYRVECGGEDEQGIASGKAFTHLIQNRNINKGI